MKSLLRGTLVAALAGLALHAEVRGNPAARRQLSTMAGVAGGEDDSVVIPYNGPAPH